MPEPVLTPLSVFFLLGFVQAVFLSLALYTAKGNHRANRYLAAVLFAFSLDLLSEFLDASLYGAQLLWLMILVFPTDMLYGPLLWFYVRCMTGQPVTVRRVKPIWQFLPFAVHAAFIWSKLPLVWDPDLFTKYPEILLNNKIQIWILDPLFAFLSIFHSAIYIVLCLISISIYKARIGDTFSYTEGIGLKWLFRLIVLLSLLLALFAFRIVVAPYFHIVNQSDVVLNICIVIVIYALGYFGIRQPVIFARLEKFETPKNIQGTDTGQNREPIDTEDVLEKFSPTAEKYAKSSLSDEAAEKLALKLKQLMHEKKPYLDNELNLLQLASLLDVSPNHLSQVVNERFSLNFFDFVNGYRVEQAKQQLINGDPKRYTILGLALDSGFNSKSAFYAGFKKHAGMTPTQFRQQEQAA